MLLLFMSVSHNFQIFVTSGEERKEGKAAAKGLRGEWWDRRTPNTVCGFSAFQHKKRCRRWGEGGRSGAPCSSGFSEPLQPRAL